MSQTTEGLDNWLRPLEIDHSTLLSLSRQLSDTFKHLALHSDAQFLSTPITRLPTGEEQGKYLAIDLGGTNLRVGFLELLGPGLTSLECEHDQLESHCSNGAALHASSVNQFRRLHEKAWPIGEHLKVDKAEDFFSWIGDCIAEVVAAEIKVVSLAGQVVPDEIPLGIAFSFPMMQKTLDQATLMPMGKGFAITSNLDLGEMLLAGYTRHTVSSSHIGITSTALPRIKIAAIINDTVATLASLAYAMGSSPLKKTTMGLIVGTGCNATIPMNVSSLHPSKRPNSSPSPAGTSVIINTEWAIKGAAQPLRNLSLITQWDTILDRATISPGFQPFEYMVAGHYLGELVRLIVLDYFTTILHIDPSILPSALLQRTAVTTTFLTRAVAPSKDASALAMLLNATPGFAATSNWIWTPELAQVLLQVNKRVIRRSIALIAAATVGLLDCAGELTNTDLIEPSGADKPRAFEVERIVACTGGLILQYEGYMAQMQASINDIVNCFVPETPHVRVSLREAPDGGIIGAGVLAATVAPSVF